MASSFTFSKTNDFKLSSSSDAFNSVKWEEEVRASSITVAYDHTDTDGETVTAYFKAELSAEDEAVLAQLVAAHDNTFPAPSPPSVVVTNSPVVYPKKIAGTNRSYGFSVNFCDKTTWYPCSHKVTDEAVGTGDDVTTTFTLAHGSATTDGEVIVDMAHGKVTDEDNVPDQDGNFITLPNGDSVSGYRAVVKVDGVVKLERDYGETTGGDYTIDYRQGTITFFAAPAKDAVITCDYYWVHDDCSGHTLLTLKPPAGKNWFINIAEAQYSGDVEQTDTIVTNVFNGLGQPLSRPTKIKNVRDVINWTNGSFPVIPAFGGSARGITNDVQIQRWDYQEAIPLYSAYGMEMRIWLKFGREFTGEWATLVFYGTEESA